MGWITNISVVLISRSGLVKIQLFVTDLTESARLAVHVTLEPLLMVLIATDSR